MTGEPQEIDQFGATRPLSEAERRGVDNTQLQSVGGAPSAPPPSLSKSGPQAEGPPAIPDVTIEGELGRGGMGIVYRGKQPFVDRRVAVKVLPVRAGAIGSTEFVDRFQREAKILASLSHPNIVACYQAGRTGAGDCFLVMELIEGPNLQDHVKKKGPLAEAHALEVVRDLAKALAHALSSGIIHRDVKPENVLLAPLEKPAPGAFAFRAKLVDLGLARPVTTDARITSAGTVVGTPSTMAPEQFDDPEHVDFRADVYGLGCVLFHALTGQPAFGERTISQLIQKKIAGDVPDPAKLKSDLSRSAADLVCAMLAPHKEERPKSYDDLIARCEELLAGASTRSAAPTAQVMAPPPAPSRAPLVVGVLVVAALGAVGAFALKGDSKSVATVEPPKPPEPPKQPDAPKPLEPTQPDAMPSFGSGEALFTEDFGAKRFASWTPFGPDGGFGCEDEGSGIIGNGHKGVAIALGAGPWRVEGTVIPRNSRDCGVRVDLASGAAIALRLQELGKTVLVSVHRCAAGALQGDAIKEPQVRKRSGDVKVDLIVVGKRLTYRVDGEDLWSGDSAEPAKGVSLYVNRPAGEGGVTFRSFQVRRPGN